MSREHNNHAEANDRQVCSLCGNTKRETRGGSQQPASERSDDAADDENTSMFEEDNESGQHL